jgi:uncharacterized protein YdbL (DUF1318 family)
MNTPQNSDFGKKLARNMAATLMSLAAYGVVATAPALAQDAVLEQAKAAGQVGEMYTGYLGVVDGAAVSADVKRRIDEVNAKRLSIYTDTSKKSGEPVATIAALTAEKQLGRARPGEAIKPGASEGWVRK